MLTLQSLREHRDDVLSALAKRHIDATAMVEGVLTKDAERRSAQTELDNVLSESNSLSLQIGGLMREGKYEDAEAINNRTAGLKAKSAELTQPMK